MQTIYACTCGSTDLYRDASIEVNNPTRVHAYSSVTCGACGYDGSHYIEVLLSYEEIEALLSSELDGQLTPEQLGRGAPTFL